MTSTETRTVQERLRLLCDEEILVSDDFDLLRQAADRIDALEKALGDVLAVVETRPATMRLRKIFVAARAALSPPSDNSDAQAGSMK